MQALRRMLGLALVVGLVFFQMADAPRALEDATCTADMVVCGDGSEAPADPAAPSDEPEQGEERELVAANPTPQKVGTTTATADEGTGGSVKVCKYWGTSYAAGGGGRNTSYGFYYYGVDDKLGAHTYSSVSAPPVDNEYTAHAWAAAGMTLNTGGGWPSGVTMSAFYPWHWKGYQKVSVDGANPTAESTSTLRLRIKNVKTQNKNGHIVTQATLQRSLWGTSTDTRIRHYDGPNDYDNTVSMGLNNYTKYRFYIHNRVVSEVDSWWTAAGDSITDWFYPTHKAWLDYVQIAFSMPPGWTVNC